MLKENGVNVTALEVGGFRGLRLVEPIIYNDVKLDYCKIIDVDYTTYRKISI